MSLGQHTRISDTKSVIVYSTVKCINLSNISDIVNGSFVGLGKNSITCTPKGNRLEILVLGNSTGRDKVRWHVLHKGQKAKKWKLEK